MRYSPEVQGTRPRIGALLTALIGFPARAKREDMAARPGCSEVSPEYPRLYE